MYCTNCGAQISDNSRFCNNCGSQLPGTGKNIPPPMYQQQFYTKTPPDPISQAATIVGIGSMVGAALTVFGWLVPWLSISGLVSKLMSLLNLGLGSGLFNITAGFGSGLQISMLFLAAGFASFGMAEHSGGLFILGLFLLVISGVLFSIPIIAVSIFRIGMQTFLQRTSGKKDSEYRKWHTQDSQITVRKRSTIIFVILVGIFLLAAIIPFGTAILGNGFYLTALGAVISFAGALISQSIMR
jgi:hypothetical protein